MTHRIHHRTLRIGEHEIFYRDAGHPDAPVVPLLHGAPASSYEGARAFTRSVPDAEVVVLDVGHFLLGSQLEAVAEHVLAFLAKQPTLIRSRT